MAVNSPTTAAHPLASPALLTDAVADILCADPRVGHCDVCGVYDLREYGQMAHSACGMESQFICEQCSDRPTPRAVCA